MKKVTLSYAVWVAGISAASSALTLTICLIAWFSCSGSPEMQAAALTSLATLAGIGGAYAAASATLGPMRKQLREMTRVSGIEIRDRLQQQVEQQRSQRTQLQRSTAFLQEPIKPGQWTSRRVRDLQETCDACERQLLNLLNSDTFPVVGNPAIDDMLRAIDAYSQAARSFVNTMDKPDRPPLPTFETVSYDEEALSHFNRCRAMAIRGRHVLLTIWSEQLNRWNRRCRDLFDEHMQ